MRNGKEEDIRKALPPRRVQNIGELIFSLVAVVVDKHRKCTLEVDNSNYEKIPLNRFVVEIIKRGKETAALELLTSHRRLFCSA